MLQSTWALLMKLHNGWVMSNNSPLPETRLTQIHVAIWRHYGPLTRYKKLQVAHAPGMPGTFSPPPISKETTSQRSRHASRHVRQARAVMHVGIAYLRWRGKRSRHSRRMRTRNFAYLARGPCHNELTLSIRCFDFSDLSDYPGCVSPMILFLRCTCVCIWYQNITHAVAKLLTGVMLTFYSNN